MRAVVRAMHLRRPRLPSILLSLTLGCGGAQATTSAGPGTPPRAEATTNAADAGPPVPAETASGEPASETQDESSIEALVADLDASDLGAGVTPTFTASLDACAPDDECLTTSTAVWDPRGRRFVVLEVDSSEAGAESAVVYAAVPGSDTVLAHRALDRQGVASLRHTLRPFARLAPPPNLIAGSARLEFSSSAYAVLVALAPPLDAYYLVLATNDDLDHPEHVLSLVRRSDASVVELGRAPGELTPCDGDGWTCDAHADDDVRCTEAEMRAERRLCVQPRSIDRVARSDDGSALLVIGTRIVAGDGGYPGHHWVVPLPP